MSPESVTITYQNWCALQAELGRYQKLKEAISDAINKAFEDAKESPLIKHDEHVIYWVQQAQTKIRKKLWGTGW